VLQTAELNASTKTHK